MQFMTYQLWENKIQTLTSDAMFLEWKKKRLRDEIVKLDFR